MAASPGHAPGELAPPRTESMAFPGIDERCARLGTLWQQLAVETAEAETRLTPVYAELDKLLAAAEAAAAALRDELRNLLEALAALTAELGEPPAAPAPAAPLPQQVEQARRNLQALETLAATRREEVAAREARAHALASQLGLQPSDPELAFLQPSANTPPLSAAHIHALDTGLAALEQLAADRQKALDAALAALAPLQTLLGVEGLAGNTAAASAPLSQARLDAVSAHAVQLESLREERQARADALRAQAEALLASLGRGRTLEQQDFWQAHNSNPARLAEQSLAALEAGISSLDAEAAQLRGDLATAKAAADTLRAQLGDAITAAAPSAEAMPLDEQLASVAADLAALETTKNSRQQQQQVLVDETETLCAVLGLAREQQPCWRVYQAGEHCIMDLATGGMVDARSGQPMAPLLIAAADEGECVSEEQVPATDSSASTATRASKIPSPTKVTPAAAQTAAATLPPASPTRDTPPAADAPTPPPPIAYDIFPQLSTAALDALDTGLAPLRTLEAERRAQRSALEAQIQDLLRQLARAEDPATAAADAASGPDALSAARLAELAARRDALQQELSELRARYKQLLLNIDYVHGLLDTPSTERDPRYTSKVVPVQLTGQDVAEAERHYSELQQRLLGRLPEFVAKAEAELARLWDELAVPQSKRDEFWASLPAERVSLEALSLMHTAISRLQHQLNVSRDVIAQIKKRDAFIKEMLDFEVRASDPKRLFGSSIRLVQEEKFRKSAYPTLLAIEEQLVAMLEEFVAKQAQPFSYAGQDDYLAFLMAAIRDRPLNEEIFGLVQHRPKAASSAPANSRARPATARHAGRRGEAAADATPSNAAAGTAAAAARARPTSAPVHRNTRSAAAAGASRDKKKSGLPTRSSSKDKLGQ